MKLLIISVLALSCCAWADDKDKDAQLLKSEYDLTPDGGYHFSGETSNGISYEQKGVLKTSAKSEPVIEVQGSNSFQSPEGETFSITYVADENGYHPEGNHLPTPPPPEPIPEYIARALKYIAEHPYEEKKL